MALLEEIRAKRTELLKIAEQYGVSEIRIFGSVARGEERPDSDVDLLVRLAKGRDYFDLGGFQYYSSEMLGRHVDVVMDHCVNPHIAPYIMQDVRPI